MALDTYSGLQTAIGDFLNRSDLTAAIPDFIRLAEAQMQRDIRHWRMEKRATATIDARFSAVPSDFLALIRIQPKLTERPLLLATADEMQTRRAYDNNTAGLPEYVAVIGGEFEFYPTPDDDYTAELLYRRTIPALSDSNTTNWLLDLAPDAYLYGALLQTAPYLQEDVRIGAWGQLYQNVVNGLNRESKRGKHGGPLIMRQPQ